MKEKNPFKALILVNGATPRTLISKRVIFKGGAERPEEVLEGVRRPGKKSQIHGGKKAKRRRSNGRLSPGGWPKYT